jgi:hypothetical protein
MTGSFFSTEAAAEAAASYFATSAVTCGEFVAGPVDQRQRLSLDLLGIELRGLIERRGRRAAANEQK